jgi:hypothetical protein
MQNTLNHLQPLVSFVDESFEEAESTNYHLSIEISAVNFCYAILDKKRNKYLVLEVFSFQKTLNADVLAFELKNLMPQQSLLKRNFKSTSISIFTTKFTFVPSALYDAENSAKFLEINAPLMESESILSESIRNLETECVYALSKSLHIGLKELFPNAVIMHTFSSLLGCLSTSFKNVSGKSVVVHLQQAHFEIVVLEDKKLIFANLFTFQTSEDFLYYLLFVFEQLKLNPENIELLLLGEIEKNSAIYSILNKYVRHVKFGKRNELFEYSYVLDSLPQHFYFNLFSQALCV